MHDHGAIAPTSALDGRPIAMQQLPNGQIQVQTTRQEQGQVTKVIKIFEPGETVKLYGNYYTTEQDGQVIISEVKGNLPQLSPTRQEVAPVRLTDEAHVREFLKQKYPWLEDSDLYDSDGKLIGPIDGVLFELKNQGAGYIDEIEINEMKPEIDIDADELTEADSFFMACLNHINMMEFVFNSLAGDEKQKFLLDAGFRRSKTLEYFVAHDSRVRSGIQVWKDLADQVGLPVEDFVRSDPASQRWFRTRTRVRKESGIHNEGHVGINIDADNVEDEQQLSLEDLAAATAFIELHELGHIGRKRRRDDIYHLGLAEKYEEKYDFEEFLVELKTFVALTGMTYGVDNTSRENMMNCIQNPPFDSVYRIQILKFMEWIKHKNFSDTTLIRSILFSASTGIMHSFQAKMMKNMTTESSGVVFVYKGTAGYTPLLTLVTRDKHGDIDIDEELRREYSILGIRGEQDQTLERSEKSVGVLSDFVGQAVAARLANKQD